MFSILQSRTGLMPRHCISAAQAETAEAMQALTIRAPPPPTKEQQEQQALEQQVQE
jgi:hypothetical protein